MTHGFILGAFAAGLALSSPVPARANVDEAVAKMREGDWRGARPALQERLRDNPSDGTAYRLLARTLLALDNGTAAQTQLELAIKAGVPVGRTHHLMGEALMLQGKADAALKTLSRPDIPRRYQGYAARIRGRIYANAGDFVQAQQAYGDALRTIPNASLLWSDIGRLRIMTGDLSGAIDAAARAIQMDPRNVDAAMLQGELARGQYGLVASIPWFERAVEIDPSHVNAMLELAATLGDAGRATDMLAMTRRALAVDGKNARAFYLQAVLAARAGKYDLSRALLYRTREILDDVPSVILLRAILDVESGNDTQAITHLKALVERQPGNLKARRLLGAALFRSDDPEATIDALRPIAMRPDADSYTLTLIGRAHEKLDQRNEAAWFLDRAARPHKGDAAPFDIPVSLAVLARANAENPNNADTAVPYITQLVATGRVGEALAEAERLSDLNPGAPAAHILVGDSLMALGRTKDAVLSYENAANIRFSEGTALRLVRAQAKAGNQAEAIRVLDLYLGQNPRNVPALMLSAEHFMMTAQWPRAIATLQRIRGRIGNRDATVLNNLAWCYLSSGDKARAIAYAKAAYAITPGNAAVASTYGWALFSTGHDKIAGLALLEKAARQIPTHPSLQYRLGEAYAKLGRREDARRALKVAVASPDFDGKAAASALLAKLR